MTWFLHYVPIGIFSRPFGPNFIIVYPNDSFQDHLIQLIIMYPTDSFQDLLTQFIIVYPIDSFQDHLT